MGNDGGRAAPEQHGTEHDPYARRPGYATGADGRTDVWTTAMVTGVVSAVAVLFVSGLVHIERPIAYPVAIVVGLAVFLVLRARRRAADRRAGRDPDEVTKARSDATAAANHGRRFFVAQNPVVVIVMGAIFLALAVVAAIGAETAGGFVVAAVLAASALFFVVQGAGTLVLQRRHRAARDRAARD
ncbi:hypothetical protein [Curtobacterium sp. B8]|uniref:hypothetical protein n=1 Tax=Curtobacterium sp. B8 TaxID=95611 RepID=UPI000344D731|nr:hypothetical protein [Curtobacterium sp. B8]